MCKRKVLVLGCVGYPNIGDILISERLQNILIDLLHLDATFVSQHNRGDFFSGKHLRFKSVFDLPNLLKILLDVDVVLIGGGGLFTDITGLPMLLYYIFGIWISKVFGKKVVCVGISIGPLRNKFSLFLSKISFLLCDRFILRDHMSKILLQNLGVKPDNIFVTVDLVCGMNKQEQWRYIKTGPQIKFTIGISLRESPSGSYFLPASVKWRFRHLIQPEQSTDFINFIDRFVDFLKLINKKYDLKFIYFPMNIERDIELYQKINAKLSDSIHIELETYGAFSIDEISKKFSKIDFFIGMPLHSIILASMTGVPFLAIPYSDKVGSYVSMLNGDDLLLPYSKGFDPAWHNVATMMFDELVKNKNKISQKLLGKMNELSIIDKKNIDLLQDIFY